MSKESIELHKRSNKGHYIYEVTDLMEKMLKKEVWDTEILAEIYEVLDRSFHENLKVHYKRCIDRVYQETTKDDPFLRREVVKEILKEELK